MLIALASHNDDIRQLLNRGYALRFDSNYLVVRSIPYLDANRQLQIGAIVCVVEFLDRLHVQQKDHQIFFAGGVPHEADGRPVANLGGGPANVTLRKTDVVVERSFSNKPPNGFPNFFEKIEHYVALISGPAMALYPEATPLTFEVDYDVVGDSVFSFQDTLTSRSLIGDLAVKFEDDVVALIGLGGTGGYLLDFMVKTNVKEIRGFDSDVYHVHNAYRSPGRVAEDEFRMGKAELYQKRYENFRKGLNLQAKHIDRSSAAELEGVTFAFVCVDKGSARGEIIDLLTELGIPFIDVGMGLHRETTGLAGTLRVTTFLPEEAADIRAKNLAETTDAEGDEYRSNIQIAELNALNACLAILRFKQIRGFYASDVPAYHILMDTTLPRLFTEPAE